MACECDGRVREEGRRWVVECAQSGEEGSRSGPGGSFLSNGSAGLAGSARLGASLVDGTLRPSGWAGGVSGRAKGVVCMGAYYGA